MSFIGKRLIVPFGSNWIEKYVETDRSKKAKAQWLVQPVQPISKPWRPKTILREEKHLRIENSRKPCSCPENLEQRDLKKSGM